MSDTLVKAGASVMYSIIDENVCVGKSCVVGNDMENAKNVTVVGAGTVLPDGTNVEEGKIFTADDVNGGDK